MKFIRYALIPITPILGWIISFVMASYLESFMNSVFCSTDLTEGADCYDPSAAWVRKFCMIVGASVVAFFHVSLVYIVAPNHKREFVNWFYCLGLLLCWIFAFMGSMFLEAIGATIIGSVTYLVLRSIGSPNKSFKRSALRAPA